MSENKFRIILTLIIIVLSVQINSFLQGTEFVYESGNRRNPFIPLVSPDGRLLNLDSEEDKLEKPVKLDGIVYDEHGLSYAIVNDSVVKVGDCIGDYQVLKIKKDSLVLIKEAQIQEIELKKEER
ncbi:MAG: hypothetical protein NC908_05465 [Candidatus Omnitrophica bacterium]|nr:hypothetical protein [Candidatus Omnitrophota bacterium]